MRTELWLSQLQRSREGMQAVQEYSHLMSRTLPASVQSEIEKDLHRTFPGNAWLVSPEGQRALYGVLKAYANADPGIGYTQGMNFLAGMILSYVTEEASAFGVLWFVMHERLLRDCYKPDMAMLQVRLWQLGQLLPPRLAEHLESHAVLPVLYASSWFLTCFASDFPLPFAARIMDLVVCDCYAAPILKVALAVMDAAAPFLIEVQDIEVAVEHLKKDVPRWPLERLQEILTEGLVKPWTPRQRAILTRINGVESVAEAVRRVERRQTVAGCEIERHASEAAEDELRVAEALPRGAPASFTRPGRRLPRPPGRSLSAAESARALDPPGSPGGLSRADIPIEFQPTVELDDRMTEVLSRYASQTETPARSGPSHQAAPSRGDTWRSLDSLDWSGYQNSPADGLGIDPTAERAAAPASIDVPAARAVNLSAGSLPSPARSSPFSSGEIRDKVVASRYEHVLHANGAARELPRPAGDGAPPEANGLRADSPSDSFGSWKGTESLSLPAPVSTRTATNNYTSVDHLLGADSALM